MDYHRSFITHAHFYQPPREDPIDDEVPLEVSAFPYHDWNEKIFQTCYRPNIELGNFSKISFNIGPTLIRWMRKKHPDALQKIIDADRESVRRNGFGNAIAQPYHHTILPLATRDEKETEIIWGIKDFIHDFGRQPEGMWLPETAVDRETLALLADHGIKFTILAPWQIAPGVDVRQSPLKVRVEDGREIAVFVYNAELSAKASFDTHATTNADKFVEENVKRMYTKNLERQFVLLATDGELYGHHQEYRDLFLGHLLNGSINESGLKLDLPSAWLNMVGELPKAEIIEYTSWSCHHGINRWREACDCTPGASWKYPLRHCLEMIAQDVDSIYKKEFEKYGIDLRDARNSFIEVINGEIEFVEWIQQKTDFPLKERDQRLIADLLIAQDYRLRMFASCGWFFDRFDRIEPKNNLTYAAYAVLLTERTSGVDLAKKYRPFLLKIGGEGYGYSGNDVFYEAYDRFSVQVT